MNISNQSKSLSDYGYKCFVNFYKSTSQPFLWPNQIKYRLKRLRELAVLKFRQQAQLIRKRKLLLPVRQNCHMHNCWRHAQRSKWSISNCIELKERPKQEKFLFYFNRETKVRNTCCNCQNRDDVSNRNETKIEKKTSYFFRFIRTNSSSTHFEKKILQNLRQNFEIDLIELECLFGHDRWLKQIGIVKNRSHQNRRKQRRSVQLWKTEDELARASHPVEPGDQVNQPE